MSSLGLDHREPRLYLIQAIAGYVLGVHILFEPIIQGNFSFHETQDTVIPCIYLVRIARKTGCIFVAHWNQFSGIREPKNGKIDDCSTCIFRFKNL